MTNPLQWIGIFRRMPAAEKRLLFTAWWLLLRYDLALRTRRYAEVEQAARPASNLESRLDDVARAVEIYRLVDVAARRHLYPMTCLRRSLALQHLLTRRAIPSTIRLGVKREDGQFHAHAWVEVSGRPIGESRLALRTFTTLETRNAPDRSAP